MTSCPSFSTDGVWDLGKLLPAAVNHERDQRAHSVPHPQTGTFGGQREAFLAFLRAGTSKSKVYGNKTHSKPLVLHHVARRENPVQRQKSPLRSASALSGRKTLCATHHLTLEVLSTARREDQPRGSCRTPGVRVAGFGFLRHYNNSPKGETLWRAKADSGNRNRTSFLAFGRSRRIFSAKRS